MQATVLTRPRTRVLMRPHAYKYLRFLAKQGEKAHQQNRAVARGSVTAHFVKLQRTFLYFGLRSWFGRL